MIAQFVAHGRCAIIERGKEPWRALRVDKDTLLQRSGN
jgi:hypothetical protein